ncbi:DUF2971 domain-containing protein [Acidovorax sp. CCYZU-2555]|uniref:DUF2971 domain-containing protein n=1 Tax=Acidovorax sp. CCYZU-2555 TaxID=2835042 RepID=UPI001BCC42EC|nr:DUF2971 domain-containing protein [Acidovorax sp. CCYZU-2555]MBS7777713.1 DUF2971 domain-containing protein [Acidovorax sp. CCYZU-2555]
MNVLIDEVDSALIYHHTTTEGLIGILENKEIWATNIRFLNDYEELVAGLRELESCMENVKSIYKEKSLDDIRIDFYNKLEGVIRDNVKEKDTFISSFTKTRDSLRQWMSYGKPNSSYSIGFDRKLLESNDILSISNISNDVVYSLQDVEYGEWMRLRNSSSLDKIMSRVKESNAAVAMVELAQDALFGCCSVKSKQFSDENEVRMIFQTKKIGKPFLKTRFRNFGGVVTPYIGAKIPSAAIKEVIVGPSVNRELSELGLSNILKKNGIDCRVSHSVCTLRQF